MDRPIVLIDVDGVIANFDQFYVDCAYKAGVIQTNVVDPGWRKEGWDIGKALGLTRDGKAQVHKYMKEPHLAQRMPAYEGAVQGVRKIMLIADVYFPTSPIYESATWEFDRWQWFQKRFDSMETANRLIFTEHKKLVYGNVFVDDKPKNVDLWAEHWRWKARPETTHAVLWPQPYNISGSAWGTRPTTRDWDWLFDYVKRSCGLLG